MNSRRYKPFLFVSAVLLITAATVQAQTKTEPANATIPLEGIWKCKLDPFFTGISSNGVQLMPQLADDITLPGSTDEAGMGYKTQGMTSLRLTRSFEYKGPVWYEKQIDVPASWKNKEVQLFLERAHWQTAAWVNGSPAGEQESLSVPHVFDVSGLIKPGEKNIIRIRVDNNLLFDIGYSHAVSAETQTNWNGIIGRMELRTFDKLYIKDVQVYPDAEKKQIRISTRILNPQKFQQEGSLTCSVKVGDELMSADIAFSGSDSVFSVASVLPLGGKALLWDEFHPVVYTLRSQLVASSGANTFSDVRTTNFGLRSVSTRGTRFIINGRESFIRSTVNSAEFPLTGYPAMDRGYWTKIFTTCKGFGLNAMRFHSWCPPEAAFEVADQMGIYLQVENSDWRFTVGKDAATDSFLAAEADRILDTYGNHPSFMFFCEGNELVGPKVKEFLSGLITAWKQKDPRHLYTGSSGYPVVPQNDFDDFYGARPQRWKEGLKGRFNVAPLQTEYDYSDYVKQHQVPLVTHEVGQWCVFPNFHEIPKFNGVLKPYNYQLFRELLRNQHLLDQANAFTMASGKFQVIQKKEEIESYLRTPGFGGYTMLQLNDFPGQGTAPVGVVDVFWDRKPYVTAEAFHQFQAPRVLLLRTSSFTWTNDGEFKALVQMANFGEASINNAVVQWSLRYPGGNTFAEGRFEKMDIPLGSPFTIGELAIPLDRISEATRLTLEVSVAGLNCSNQWNIWVYPKRLPAVATGRVLISYDWDRKTKDFLEKGGKVLLLADTSKIALAADPVFSGISWNTVWSGMPPNLLGILCAPEHPALKSFPTQFHSNWQWWDLVHHSRPMILDSMPPEYKPLVQMIPDWNNPHKIGLLFEARVGKGSLLISAIDLRHDMEQRPVARQMLYSLKNYVAGKQFAPVSSIAVETIDKLFKN